MSLVLLVPYFCPHIAFFAVPYLATATSFAVDARILTCHNLHIVASDGNTCGTIITRKAAKKMKARVIKKKKSLQFGKKITKSRLQCIQKVFTGLYFLNILMYCSLIPKLIKKCYLKIPHTHTHKHDRVKKVSHFCKAIAASSPCEYDDYKHL